MDILETFANDLKTKYANHYSSSTLSQVIDECDGLSSKNKQLLKEFAGTSKGYDSFRFMVTALSGPTARFSAEIIFSNIALLQSSPKALLEDAFQVVSSLPKSALSELMAGFKQITQSGITQAIEEEREEAAFVANLQNKQEMGDMPKNY